MAVPPAVHKGVTALAIATVATVGYGFYAQIGEDAEPMSGAMWLASLVVNGALLLLLGFARQGQNWARWTALVLIALGILVVFVDFGDSSMQDRIFELIIVAIELWGCYQLLSKAASSWFQSSTRREA